MVSVEFLENCPITHFYGQVIKDNNNNIVDFEIIYTNLYKKNLILKEIKYYILEQKNWKDVLIKCLKKGSTSFIRYIKEVNSYVIIELQKVEEDKVIVWLTKDVESEHKKDSVFEMVCDSMPDAIYYKDIDGRYISCNQSYANILLLEKEDIIGKRDKDLQILKHFDKNIIEVDREIMKSGKAKVYSAKLSYPNGDMVEFETKKTPYLDKNNESIGIVGITRDISHRKDENKELEKLRMEFFANLSHEFRTPINLIFSSVQLINILSKDKNKSNTYDKYLEIIKQNSYRLSKLVNNLIDSTKVGSGYFEYKPQNYDMVSFVESICISVAEYASQRDVEIIFDTDVEEKIIGFDLNQVERIVLNLLSNAIKFSESNGRIFINITSEEEYVKVSVKDEGIGIPEEKLWHVFEKFKQVNNRMTKISEGSGIGLSLVKSFVEMHGGYVDVKSKLNEGSEFTFALPNIIIDQTFDSFLNVKLDEDDARNRFVETIKVEFSDIY
ncbi:MAG: PAS domain-containing sensor histidine kinase [Peptostreptococcaceae bacterium]